MTDGVFDITTGINVSVEATDEDMIMLAGQLTALLAMLESTETN